LGAATDAQAQSLLVVIPTYNERDNIEAILHRLREANPQAHALVVDDASPDGTGDIADRVSATDDWVHVLHRPGKAGLGAAYIAGFRWALERGYDVIVEMDADGSHAPEQLPGLLSALADADVVLGSRWVPGGKIVNWPMSRMLLSRGGNVYTRLALGMDLRDATGGFRLRGGAASWIWMMRLWALPVDLAWQAVRDGFRSRCRSRSPARARRDSEQRHRP
jgi:dolichol-phosphate mannosyltransferase